MMPPRLLKIAIHPDASIRQALKVIDDAGHRTALVISRERRLLGVITDGNIRRWILQNGPLDQPVSSVMTRTPVVFHPGDDPALARDVMQANMIQVIPVVDHQGVLVEVHLWQELFGAQVRTPAARLGLPVVIMAGGEGSRLLPFTRILPKPLLPIGDKPIIEHIIDRFVQHGCTEFYLTLNYLAGMIRAFFGDHNNPYGIRFVEESKPLGTGGSLHLLDGVLDRTFFVSNCDVLVAGDYADMLRCHREQGNRMTMVASLKHYTVPYGVVQVNGSEQVATVTEKPELNWLVNTGLYILEPEALRDIPKDTFFHITDLISRYLREGVPVGVYPVSEGSWMDMGQLDEMREMMKKLGL
jgi:dTDP-glucose pyrophosphorylase